MSQKTCNDRYYTKNKEKILAQQKLYKLANPELTKRHALNKHFRKKYGITLEERNLLLRSQNFLCAICGNPEEMNRNLAVDHDHKTGRVRGLLCFICNAKVLPAIELYSALLVKAKNYLEKYAPTKSTSIKD